jgi:hypothetical protein
LIDTEQKSNVYVKEKRERGKKKGRREKRSGADKNKKW